MFAFLNPYMLWVKIGGAVLAVLAIFGAGMWLEAKFKAVEIANLHTSISNKQAADATASLKQLQSFIANMQGASDQYGKDRDGLFAALGQLHKDFSGLRGLKPLPVGCVPDADRLRILSASVAAVNAAAAGRSPSGPLHSPQ